MVEECRDLNSTLRYHGAHHEPLTTINCQEPNELIQNDKCQESEYPCMTCKNRGTLDKNEECNYCNREEKSKKMKSKQILRPVGLATIKQ